MKFGQATITYLGKEVGKGQVRPVEAKVAAITEFPAPQTRRELCRFLGIGGYYHSFCRNFSTVACPLTSLLSPSNPFVWTKECQHAFDSVKVLLCSVPVLADPDLLRPFKLEVDASAVCVVVFPSLVFSLLFTFTFTFLALLHWFCSWL